MKNKWFALAMGLLLMVGIAIVALGVVNWLNLPSASTRTVTLAQPAQNQPAQVGAAAIAGAYSGAVELNVTVGGVFSDTLATPPAPGAGTPTPPDLGSIDLSLQLTQTGNALSGYVSLDKTLVYSTEHTLGAGANSIKIGPYLSGSFDGTNLTVQSEKVALTVSGRSVQRQFRLTGTSTAGDGGQVSGEYRETLWGYANVPVTVIGSFTLQRPGFGSTGPVAGNQAPVVVADTATTTQGAAVTINVLANDTDANGGALTITSVSKPQFGAATTNGQSVTYTPNANFVGTDTFSYVISDGQGGTATSSVSITVNGSGGANQAPTAANDTATTTASSAVTIDVLANDADPDGDVLAITIDGPPSHGTATMNTGKVVYTPQAGFTGSDSFTYIVSDGKGGTATGSVSITVTGSGGANRAPTAANDTATTQQGIAILINVMVNDTDPDGDALTITINGQPGQGTAQVENGQIRYTPTAGFDGTDTLTYVIADGKGGTATATVTITVTPTSGGNQPPVAANDTVSTALNRAITINVLANDSDPDGDALTVAILTAPANGTAAVDNGRVVYTPNAGFVGSDSFTYTLTDGKGGSTIATVLITVTDQPGGGASSLYLPLIQR